MDYLGDADALAALFPSLTPPANPSGGTLQAIRQGTARPPTALGLMPAVVVFLETSDLVSGNGTRAGGTVYLARFYLGEEADLERDGAALMAWASVLADVLKDHVQLDGRANVARAVVDALTVGRMPYAGRQYSGIELRVRLTTSESWLATP